MAPGARVGFTGRPLELADATIDFGVAADSLRNGSLGLSEARSLDVFKQRISDEGIATIPNMLDALDGYEEDGVVLDTTTEVVTDDGTVQRDTIAVTRFSKLGLVEQLFHTVASPAVAYLLLLVGLALLVFEFYTAGVGIAGVVGAGATILACYGLAELPDPRLGVGVDRRRDGRVRGRRAGRVAPRLDRRRRDAHDRRQLVPLRAVAR